MLRLPRLLAAVFAAILVCSGTAYPAFAEDHPTAGVQAPSDGSYAQVGVPLLVYGSAVNGEAGGITGVDVSVDGGATWQPGQELRERWRFRFTPTEAGDVTIIARARTASTVGAPGAPTTVHVGTTGPLPPVHDATSWLDLPEFDKALDPDWEPVELGLRFQVDRPGKITGVRVQRGTSSAPLEVRMWSGDGGLLLDTTSERGEWATQWVDFPTPVEVVPGRDYVVSYFSAWSWRYQASEDYFTGAVHRTPFVLQPGAGVFHYGAHGGFPTDTWHDSNYWIVPLFHP